MLDTTPSPRQLCRTDFETSVESPKSLLALPAEIRCEIYRQLLVNSGHIFSPIDEDSEPGPAKSSDQLQKEPHFLTILFVCRSLYAEASTIWYGTIGFEFHITCSDFSDACLFFQTREIDFYNWKYLPFERMRNFRVIVEFNSGDWMLDGLLEVIRVCKILRQFCLQIHQLELQVKIDSTYGAVSRTTVRQYLEPFACLNNVRDIKCVDVPPVLAQYLAFRMTGSEPPHPLEK